MNSLISYLMREQLEKAVKDWGIEGTEDKIRVLYANMNKLKNMMINELHTMYNFGKDNNESNKK